jgi:UDP:flavonoid glycosyltransferase YjiC (YdhE family)
MKAMVHLFCSALCETPGSRGFIRLHPSLKVGDVEGLVTGPSAVRIAPPSMSLEACLAASDLVVSGGSGLVEDSLTAGRPVAVLLQEHEGESSWAGRLVERSGCPGLRSAAALGRVLSLALDTRWRERQVKMAAPYLRWAYALRGEDAARATAGHLLGCSARECHHPSVAR